MPAAARLTDPTSHGAPLSPGSGSPSVKIGMQPAWRALPAAVGAAVAAASEKMKALMDVPQTNPAAAAEKIAQISSSLTEAGAKAAAAGTPAAASAASSGLTSLNATNTALTATWTTASAAPGGQPAADIAYTQGIKAAAAAAAAAVFSAIGALADTHMCPTPSGPIPHGPGMVTKGSSSVNIDGLPAARQNDKVMEAAGGADPIAGGDPTVNIGG